MRKKFFEVFALDLRSLALMRISIGLILMIDLILRSRDISAFYTDDGIFPRIAFLNYLQTNAASISFHTISGSFAFQVFLFFIAFLFAGALCLGFRTRAATLLSWIFITSLHYRNPFLLNGGDELLRLLLLWGIFLPWGKVWSVDAKGKSPESFQINTLGTFAYCLQFIYLYVFAAMSKIQSPAWQSGQAVWYIAHLEHYAYPWMYFLREQKTLATTATYGALVFEAIAPFLLFSPIATQRIRTIVLSLFFFMQLTFLFFLYLGLFPFISITASLGLIPTSVWNFLQKRHQKVLNVHENFFFHPILSFFLICMIVYPLAYRLNIGDIVHRAPKSVRTIASFLALNQQWYMFTKLTGTSVWNIPSGKLKNGMLIDVRNGTRLSLKKPDSILAEYSDRYWRSYFVNNFMHQFPFQDRKYYALYWCRKWNKENPKNRVEVVRWITVNYDFYKPEMLKKKTMVTITCPEN